MDETAMKLVGVGVLILVSSLGGWLATRRMKRKLKEGLGHEVKDEDVMSISAWMKADDKVVDSVIHDDSPEHSIEGAMENCFANYADRHDRSSQ
jgi:hypothetical protein